MTDALDVVEPAVATRLDTSDGSYELLAKLRLANTVAHRKTLRTKHGRASLSTVGV